MNRKTAIATALAITMSLTSGVVAWSANAGMLGFGGSTVAAATPSVVVPAAAGAVQVASKVSSRAGEHDDSARVAQLGAERAASTKGENYD